MRLRIHRGTREIGGTCVELESAGYRILLDLGLPLDAADIDAVPLPGVSGLATEDPSFLGVILSHGHRDHWGLVPKARADMPVIMGRAVEAVMRAASDFVPGCAAIKASAYLESGNTLQIGPFAVLPWLVDHSGFDAYALQIDSDRRRLFYSGDLRGHGRKAKLFERLLADPPQNVDVMLMEGSSLGRVADDGVFESESDLEETFVARFKETAGMALVACSPQNIDRVVTIYRAAKRTDRTVIVDAYAAEVLKATGYATIPKPADDWSNIAVYIPQRQRVQLKKRGTAGVVDSYRGFRIWPEQLAELSPRAVMLFRGWMLNDLTRAGALSGARVFWSQWDGYLKDGSGLALRQECHARNMPFEVVHTSGHASPTALKHLASAIAPKRLIPIHTFQRYRFPELFENVTIVDDGQWIEV